MGSKQDMTRKDFLTLTFTLIGGTVVGGACSSDNNNNDGGFAGTFGNSGTGRGGTTGAGGTSGAGTGGAAGTSAGTGGTTGTAGAGGNGTATACSDPLPEMQSASDHTHTVTVHPSMLDSTTAVTLDTSLALAHMHMVTFQPAQLATLKGGGSVTVMSTAAGLGPHTHEYTVTCH